MAIFDDFDDPAPWVCPIYQYGMAETGGAEIADGALSITRTPAGKYHRVSAERSYEAGMNGEQHWRMFDACVAKEWDDELFLGSPGINGEDGGKRTDMRVGLPTPISYVTYATMYSEWEV
jgi:hypothetical protein